jgi:hypothetical protein
VQESLHTAEIYCYRKKIPRANSKRDEHSDGDPIQGIDSHNSLLQKIDGPLTVTHYGMIVMKNESGYEEKERETAEP